MTNANDWAKQARDGKRGRLLGALQAAKARLSTTNRVSTYTQQQAIFLALAEEAAEAEAIDVAWQMLFAAERAAIEGYTDAECAAHRDMLLSEATDKLDSWRREAVLRLLAGPPTLGALQAATRIRDERHENVYRQQSMVKSQLKFFSLILVITLLGFAGLAWAFPRELEDQRSESFAVFVFLAGIAGASVSALRSTPIGGRKSPQMVLDWYASAARLLVGGAAALVLYLALRAGVIAIGDGSGSAMLLVGFAAGFSERLLLMAMDKVSNTQPPAATTSQAVPKAPPSPPPPATTWLPPTPPLPALSSP
jgi:hypothetical protein